MKSWRRIHSRGCAACWELSSLEFYDCGFPKRGFPTLTSPRRKACRSPRLCLLLLPALSTVVYCTLLRLAGDRIRKHWLWAWEPTDSEGFGRKTIAQISEEIISWNLNRVSWCAENTSDNIYTAKLRKKERNYTNFMLGIVHCLRYSVYLIHKTSRELVLPHVQMIGCHCTDSTLF